MAKLVSKVYGDALFEAAQETKCLDETFEQVLALQEILKEHEDLIQLLNHPQVVKEEKIQIIDSIFRGRVSDDMMGFLTTVVEKGRQGDIPAIFEYFITTVKEYNSICDQRGSIKRGTEGAGDREITYDHPVCGI